MQSWENILVDSEKAKCRYNKYDDRCRFETGSAGKNRLFLYIFVLISVIYSCRSVRKLDHLLEHHNCIIPEESARIDPDEISIEVSENGIKLIGAPDGTLFQIGDGWDRELRLPEEK